MPQDLYKRVELDLVGGEEATTSGGPYLSYEIDDRQHLIAYEFDTEGSIIQKYLVSVIVVPISS